MARAEDIEWGSYRDYEGPFYKGTQAFKLPEPASDSDRVLAVITATEGGRWDAYNGYDRCICTSGLIQWCEAGQFSVSAMLGKVAEADRSLLAPLVALAGQSGLEFRKNARGRYRFFFVDARGEVDRTEEQQQMFLLRSNGRIGTWDSESKAYAKEWAAAISTVWEHPEARRQQASYTTARLGGFALPFARTVLGQAPATDLGHAFKAMYLSFAANNPTWANKHLEIASRAATAPAFSLDWLIAVVRELTFGPQIAIYPHRYARIRPVLEKLYAVDLPDLVEDLQRWVQTHGETMLDVTEVQEILIRLGLDLGPWGADGKFGKKSREALITFQQQHGLPPSGVVDPATHRELLQARDANA